MRRRRRLRWSILLATALALAGCAGSPTLAALDAAPGGTVPPNEVQNSGTVDGDSIRHLVTHESIDYFAARALEPDNHDVCVIVVPDEEGWIAGCGVLRDGLISTVRMDGTPEVALVADGGAEESLQGEGWTQIHENLWVRD